MLPSSHQRQVIKELILDRGVIYKKRAYSFFLMVLCPVVDSLTFCRNFLKSLKILLMFLFNISSKVLRTHIVMSDPIVTLSRGPRNILPVNLIDWDSAS